MSGALERLGLYLARSGLTPVALFHSEGLLQSILDMARQSPIDGLHSEFWSQSPGNRRKSWY
jgi:hypothetical protein